MAISVHSDSALGLVIGLELVPGLFTNRSSLGFDNMGHEMELCGSYLTE